MALLPLGFLQTAKKYLYTWITSQFAVGQADTYTVGIYASFATDPYLVFSGSISYYRSANGTSWSEFSMPSDINLQAVTASGTRILVGGSTGGGFYSDNGTTWTATTIFTVGGVENLFYTGTRFIALNNNASQNFGDSTDGITWNRRDIGTGTIDSSGNLVGNYDGTTYAIADQNGVNIWTSTSTGTTTWTRRVITSIGTPRSMVLGAGTFVLFGSTGYAYSTNGTTWVNRTYLDSASPDNVGVYKNGFFYYIDIATSSLYYTTDPTATANWRSQVIPISDMTLISSWIDDGTQRLIGIGTSTSSRTRITGTIGS